MVPRGAPRDNGARNSLRYVERAKRIVVRAVVNDGETNPVLVALRAENSELREQLADERREGQRVLAQAEAAAAAAGRAGAEARAQVGRRGSLTTLHSSH